MFALGQKAGWHEFIIISLLCMNLYIKVKNYIRENHLMFITKSLSNRFFHTSLQRSLPRRGANPGIGYQLQGLQDDGHVLNEDPEGFGNLEADFTGVHRTHREHEREMAEQRERVRQLMVKHKYFREQKLPNLLTYAEKEQIRMLHNRDATEWTAERLAESFPATPDIIRKVLRAKWKPNSADRLRAHDEAVLRNWEKLRDGKDNLEIPNDLRKHLQNFATRKIEDLLQQTPSSIEWATQSSLPKPKGQEFLSIITSLKKYADSNKSTGEQQPKLKPPAYRSDKDHLNFAPQSNPLQDAAAETYLMDKVKDKRQMRLQEVKRLKLPSTEQALNEEQQPSPEQAAITINNPGGTGVVKAKLPGNELDYIQKFEDSEIVISAEDQRRYEMSTVKDRVYIPRKVWRKGATFRIEDSYYDDDGEFLYRVPGMTGKS